MTLRSLAIFAALAFTGCIAPRAVVNPTDDKAAAKAATPSARFQEFITVPGQYVATNPSPALPPPPSEAPPLWPPKASPPVYQQTSLLTPTAQPDPVLVLALRDYLDGHADKAIERIKDLDPANLEILLRLLPAVALAFKADLSGRTPSDAAVLASQLEAAAEAADKLTSMQIRKACLVWRVAQFGVYEPVPEKHPFLPGGSGVLYLELQNAPSLPAELPAGGKGYVTRLSCSHYLADAEGKPIAAAKKFDHAEYTRSPVRDYFLKIEFDVPTAPGNYTLVVELTDPATKRSTKQRVDLNVGN